MRMKTKFSQKIVIWATVMMAAALGFGGLFFVNYVFHTSLLREVGQAMDENSILQFAFETAALNVPSKYAVLQDTTIEQIGKSLEKGRRGTPRMLRLSDEEQNTLYASQDFVAEEAFLSTLTEKSRSYQIVCEEEKYYIRTGVLFTEFDRKLYLETLRDITDIFEERNTGFRVYRRMTAAVLCVSLAVMLLITRWLTKPIRTLTQATKKMAEGEYSYRAKVESSDELGILTEDFNQMAAALENNVQALEREARSREAFVAAFAHELKTPLTAIIGYADLLRSRKLTEERHFTAANYIYTEGKRLEAMALKLLDIIVTKQGKVQRREQAAEQYFAYLKLVYEQENYDFSFSYEEGTVFGESNLIKTVLVNLVDNACKASEEGGKIMIGGQNEDAGYRFFVEDRGIGIPKEEIQRITEAFYMVDKSRSRSKNGAGLGLSLCVEILKLHHTELMIESTVGEGTRMSFLLPAAAEKRQGQCEE